MRIEPRVYLVGSGRMGFDMTHPLDCNIYLFDTGAGYALFDIGAGLGLDALLAVCAADGIDPAAISHLFLTHAHTDHAGGAAALRERLPVTVVTGEATGRIVAAGDAEAVSLPDARRGGMYPADYIYHACPVDRILAPGEEVALGDLSVQLLSTPGHSHDHSSYLVSGPGKRYLVAGDAIFFGGRIVLQNTYDCNVPQSIATIKALAEVTFDALLPGHLNFSLNNGRRHVEAACAVIDRMGCPPALG